MISVLKFAVFDGENEIGRGRALIKQTVGTKFDEGQLEVTTSGEYGGPINGEQFQHYARDYYSNLVGAQGKVIRFEGATSIIMRNNHFQVFKCYQMEVEKTQHSAW